MARARSVSDDIGGESSTEDNPNKRIKLEETESKEDDDDNDHSEGNKDSPSPTTSDDEAAMEDQKIQPSDTVFCRKMMVALSDFEITVLHKTKIGSGTEESKEKLEAVEDMLDDPHKVRQFVDLGGITRLLNCLEHIQEDPETTFVVMNIFDYCRRWLRPINDTIRFEMEKLIVRGNGIEWLLRSNDCFLEIFGPMRADAIEEDDGFSKDYPTLEAVYSIWDFLSKLTAEREIVLSTWNRKILIDSAFKTLEKLFSDIECIDDRNNLFRCFLSQTIIMILQALFYLLKSSKIKHFEVHKMAIEKWVGLMERCSGVVNKPLLSRLLGQIRVFIHRFYRQVQLGRQPLSWMCHERIVSCLTRYMRDNPAEPENEDVFPILEWVIEQEVVTKSVFLQKHHLATALAMVMESENVEAHNKERAWKIQKSLND